MVRVGRHWRYPLGRVATAATLVVLLAGTAGRPASVAPLHARGHVALASGCTLANGIRHVIYIEFDNTHFMRDIGRDGATNVPSDLEQMPHLLNFIEGNGTILTNHHTPLISHTSDDITTSETGVYPSRHGVATAENSYFYYDNTGTPHQQSGFTYWTTKIGDGSYNFTSAPNTNAPAPWAPYTRAGCNVGAAAMTGFALENTTTDLAAAFGPNPPTYPSENLFADFIGVAVHCARNDPLCSSAHGGFPDRLPNEPNPDGSPAPTDASGTSTAYEGYNALYGHRFLTQALTMTGQIAPTAVLTDINGNAIVDDVKGSLIPGFPGFSLQPQYALGYVADMQEHGVPVTFAFIITPHRPFGANPYGYGFPSDSPDYGPGEAHYVAQLKQYDDAFAKFFTRLANDDFDKSNTLFVITAEEGDHHISEAPVPRGCDGVTVPCTYPTTLTPTTTGVVTTSLGELTTNYTGLLQAEQDSTVTNPAAATVNNDDAPDIYLQGKPGPNDPTTRAFERATGALTVTNPLSVAAGVPSTEMLVQQQANPTEFQILHMLTADPLRTPSFTAFAQSDYYVTGGSPTCSLDPAVPSSCVVQSPAFNWNHGDYQRQISTTWLGLVGPGVQNKGIDGPDPIAEARGVRFATFSDHTDIRPTMLTLVGLRDDYSNDGRVLIEDLADAALPPALQSGGEDRAAYIQLAQLYKQLTAPVGTFGLLTLQASTLAMNSTSPGDGVYTCVESALKAVGRQRDFVAGLILDLLNGAMRDNPSATSARRGMTLANRRLDARLIDRAYRVLAQSGALATRASSSTWCCAGCTCRRSSSLTRR